MNKIVLLIGVAAVTLSAITSVNAQIPTYGWTSVGGLPATLTNGTANVTNFPSPLVIYTGKQRYVAVAFSVSQSGGDVTNTVFALEPSIDAVRWNTTANDIKYISVVGAGVATTVYTNFDTLGYGYWGVVSETNTALHTTTNNGIWYSQKISSP